MKSEEDTLLILSGVRALIGEVTPPLRSVSIEVKDNKIYFQCLFDETVTNDDFELMSCVAAEIIADFPNYTIEEVLKKVSQHEGHPLLKNVLFHRHESNYWKT